MGERPLVTQCRYASASPILVNDMRLIRICPVLLAALGLLAGCSVGPRYTKPEAPMSAAFKENADWKRAEPADDIPRGRWWTVFADPQLSALVFELVQPIDKLRCLLDGQCLHCI